MVKIVIDGNISSGKTTQLSKLEKTGFKVKREPFNEWPLELYYSDPKRWGLAFQLKVLNSHSQTENCDCIYERFPGSGIDVFWPAMEKNDIEDDIYRSMYDHLSWIPDIYILIDKSPTLCYSHLVERGQTGDESVSFEYIETLHKNYNSMFEKLDCKKVKINGDQSIHQVNYDIIKFIRENTCS
jgi:deoxyadenosine/deoxycytidine kinase